MRLRTLGAVALVLLLSATGAWAQAKVPGVTDTEVVIGITTPLSGPAAAWGATGLGAEAWAKYVNDKGGVHGRKIRVVMKDDAYTPGKALANLNEMKDQVFAIVGLLGTAVVAAGKDVVLDAGIPLVQAYGDVGIWTKVPKEKLRWAFVSYPDYTDEGEFLLTYGAKNLGVKKAAVFYQNDGFGKGMLEGAKRAVKAVGGQAQIVAEIPYEVAETDLKAHALKLKESGADMVLLFTTPRHGAIIVKTMAAAGYRPKLMSGFPLGSPVMFKLLEDPAGNLWEGAYVDVVGPMYGVDREATAIVDILTKYEPRLKGGGEQFGLLAAPYMMLAVEGLKRAGRDLTREKFVKALEATNNWVPEGGGVPITFGPNRRHGANAVRLMKAEKGTYVPLTGYQQFPPLF
jgi:ABC-type branched-subunit amino acid transport system substrate-binding protein